MPTQSDATSNPSLRQLLLQGGLEVVTERNIDATPAAGALAGKHLNAEPHPPQYHIMNVLGSSHKDLSTRRGRTTNRTNNTFIPVPGFQAYSYELRQSCNHPARSGCSLHGTSPGRASRPPVYSDALRANLERCIFDISGISGPSGDPPLWASSGRPDAGSGFCSL